ncbi:MAG: superoxide dismutase [Polyangiaceae bacterium]|nr:superoxide dismutase [Polyangiaceae bacterium]
MTEYTLPPLPYAYGALEPFLSARALELHHSKHHAAYVTGANAALEALVKARATGDHGLVEHWSRKLAFHVSGHFLHSLFWESMAPRGKTAAPSPAFVAAAKASFGDLEAMKLQFAAAGRSVEGNGWAVLGFDLSRSSLLVLQLENHQKQTTFPFIPLLACDVWEHAYYLDYQNRRADFVAGFWEVVAWGALSARYARAVEMSRVG